MPELPEVETIKQGLSKKIVGLKIKDVQILNSKTFSGDEKQLKNKKVKSIWRKAKVLGIDLENNLTLLFHLKMSGQLVYQGKQRFVGGHPTTDMTQEMPNKSTSVIFEFSDKSKLFFNDQRKFGWIRIIDNGQLKMDNFLKNLGPEPLEKDFTVEVFKKQLLKRKNLPIKVALMDQSLISGIGNIYASEACFDAKIDPGRKVSELSDQEFKKMHQGIIKSLEDGIKHGGATRAHFVDAEGHKGYFLDYAYVYGKDKHPCKVCGGIIKKITQAGRGTYYCPKCQK